MRSIFLGGLVGLLLATLAHAADTIAVDQPWARATIGHATTSAAYLTITNKASQIDRLTGASSPAAGKVELHMTTREGDVMRMREVAAVEIKPGERTVFQPGGLHIMLLDLKAPLKIGETVPLVLEFEKAGRVAIRADVRAAGAGGHAGH